MPFVQDHRPVQFGDLVFADVRTEKEVNMLITRNHPGNLLFVGPYGTGKSVAAEVIANTLLDDTFVFNGRATAGTMLTTIPQVNSLGNFISYPPMGGARTRVLIINELDAMSSGLQVALHEVMDRMGNLGVVIATANHAEKITGGLMSRFRPIHWAEAVPNRWLPRARQILEAEGVQVDDAELLVVLERAHGDVRVIMRNLEDLTDMARAQAVTESR
ncbi:MAG: AAA family ATPase [Rhodospirillaceae bacterium]